MAGAPRPRSGPGRGRRAATRPVDEEPGAFSGLQPQERLLVGGQGGGRLPVHLDDEVAVLDLVGAGVEADDLLDHHPHLVRGKAELGPRASRADRLTTRPRASPWIAVGSAFAAVGLGRRRLRPLGQLGGEHQGLAVAHHVQADRAARGERRDRADELVAVLDRPLRYRRDHVVALEPRGLARASRRSRRAPSRPWRRAGRRAAAARDRAPGAAPPR